jgi:predicted TIM-barrel fold metal-dependent hydrolase
VDSVIGAPLRSPWFWEVLFLTARYDASISELVDAVGADPMVFGSDWPHGGGRGTPLDYEFDTLGEAERRFILRDTTAALLGLDGGGHGYT